MWQNDYEMKWKEAAVTAYLNYWELSQRKGMAVFWAVAPCSLVEVYQRFRGPCCLHHQTIQCDNPEDSHLRTHRRENLKSYFSQCSLLIWQFAVNPLTWNSVLGLSPSCSVRSPRLYSSLAMMAGWNRMCICTISSANEIQAVSSTVK
jgi:hypothetical protein